MKHVIPTLILILLAHVMEAQSDALNFINFTSKDGLSANKISVIFKDKYGYMWFGNDDGLNKFDGETFTVYRHNAKDIEYDRLPVRRPPAQDVGGYR